MNHEKCSCHLSYEYPTIEMVTTNDKIKNCIYKDAVSGLKGGTRKLKNHLADRIDVNINNHKEE